MFPEEEKMKLKMKVDLIRPQDVPGSSRPPAFPLYPTNVCMYLHLLLEFIELLFKPALELNTSILLGFFFNQVLRADVHNWILQRAYRHYVLHIGTAQG